MIPKYRAWQKYHKRMLKVKRIEFNKDVGIEAITVWNSLNTIPFTNTYIKDADFDIEALILMQSTGIKDKNGVEIFEGDIVNIHWFYFDGGGESEVQLHRKEILNYKGVLCFEWQYDYCPLALGNWHEESFEVVGNIYENPELLGVEE